MKTVISSLVIFSIIIGSGLSQFYVTDKYVKTLNYYIDELDSAVQKNNPEALKSELKKTTDAWKKMRFVLCLMIKHDYLFEIDSALTELESFSDSFDMAEATLSVSKARAGAQCITETSSFIIENII